MNIALRVLALCLLVSSPQFAHGADIAACENDLKKDFQAFDGEDTKQEFERGDCAARDVICVSLWKGSLIPSEPDPHLRSNQSFTVKLFGPASCLESFSVGIDQVESNVTMFRQTAKEKEERAGKPAPKKLVELAKATGATKSQTESVTVYVTQTATMTRQRGQTFVVTPPRYYFDVGLMGAFTTDYRQVSTSTAPGSTEQFIRETSSIRPAVAIGVSFFPAGQYATPRFSGRHGLGFQVAVGADFTRIDDEFYFGLLWEPIPGAGIGGGIALIQMEKLQPGFVDGVLVSPGNVPKDSFLGTSTYFSISFNTEVWDTIVTMAGGANVPK